MNLRKEIEKLPGLDGSRVCPSAWVYRIDVLALLDRYELVAEYENGEVAFVRLWLKSDGPQDGTQDICTEDAKCVYVYKRGGPR